MNRGYEDSVASAAINDDIGRRCMGRIHHEADLEQWSNQRRRQDDPGRWCLNYSWPRPELQPMAIASKRQPVR